MRHYDTRFERWCLWYLRIVMGYEVVNPNGLLEEGGEWFKVAKRLIDGCDCLVFTEYAGCIGYGVAIEIKYTLETNKDAWLLRRLRFHPVKMSNIQVLNIDRAVQFARIVIS
jgi:hypothetical protein